MKEKFINVRMNNVQISTDEVPIIGTDALATCVGILLYSKANKKAIVAHVADNYKDICCKTIEIIFENKLDNDIIKYKIIPGYYYNHYKIKEKLEYLYSTIPDMFIPFDEEEITDDAIKIDEEFTCHKFAFDASTGKFVTNKIYSDEKKY